MNKIKEAICSFLTVMLCFFPLTGCYNHSDPESVVIDGVKYVTGFYGDLGTGLPDKAKKTCLFETETHCWWRYEKSVYDLYYCTHKESIGWDPVVYCREEQFDEVKAYYEDLGNYCFHFHNEWGDNIIIPEEEDNAVLNQAVLYAMEAAKHSTYNPFGGFEYTVVRKTNDERMYLYNWDRLLVVIGRTSKDGIFGLGKTYKGYSYYEGKLYGLVRESDLFKNEFTDTFYHLNAEPYTYYLSLFEKYALPQILADKGAAEAEEPGESEKTSVGIAVG